MLIALFGQLPRPTTWRRAAPTTPATGNLLRWPMAEDERLPSHFWQRCFSLALRWLALLAIVVPLFVSFVDNHYAQRDPHHGHIYVGAVVLDHYHPPPQANRQRQSNPQQSGDFTGAYSLPASSAAAAERTPQTTRPPAQLLLVLSGLLLAAGLGLGERLFPDLLPAREELFLPPPEKPPRLALCFA